MAGVSFGGVLSPGGITKKFVDLFDEEYNDDGCMVAVSKETFHQDDDDLSFDYKYVIDVMDMCAAVGKDDAPEDNMIVNLYIIPTPASLCKDMQQSILDSMGSDDINAICYQDIIWQGGADVLVDRAMWHSDEELYDVTNDPQCVKTLDTIATVLDVINSMRGFYFDKYWNMIGSTGWDTLEHAIHGEDWIKPALNRCAATIEERGAV